MNTSVTPRLRSKKVSSKSGAIIYLRRVKIDATERMRDRHLPPHVLVSTEAVQDLAHNRPRWKRCGLVDDSAVRGRWENLTNK